MLLLEHTYQYLESSATTHKVLYSSLGNFERLRPAEGHDDSVICCCIDATICYFRVFHFVCGLVVVFNLTENCIMLANDYNSSIRDVKDMVIRLYNVLFCILCVFVELDFRYVVDHIKLFDNWIFRGMFYVYVGFVTVSRYIITPQLTHNLRQPSSSSISH